MFEYYQTSPTELDYDLQAWSPLLLLHHVKEEYGAEHSKRHTQYLLNEAGLSWWTAQPRNHEADPEKEAEFQRIIPPPTRMMPSWRAELDSSVRISGRRSAPAT